MARAVLAAITGKRLLHLATTRTGPLSILAMDWTAVFRGLASAGLVANGNSTQNPKIKNQKSTTVKSSFLIHPHHQFHA
jgi:hypothetical protein